MALSGWANKCLITVAANKITNAGTNQVLFFTAGHFNPAMLTLGGSSACKSDGSDIRFSTDSDGNTLLASNVMGISLSATVASSTILVAVRFPTITANASFSFYCHWGNASADFPAASSAIGSGSCWSEFYGVLPLQEDPTLFTTTTTKWKCFKDVTGRYASGSLVGAPTKVAGPIPGMSALSVGTTGGIQVPEVASTAKGGFQIAMIAKIATFTGFYFGQSNTAVSEGFAFDAGIAKVQYAGNWGVNFSDQAGVWGILRAKFNTAGTAIDVTFGSKTTTITWTGPFSNLQYISSGSAGLGMLVSCFMINQFVAVPDTYLTNILDSMNNNAALARAGDIESAGTSNVLTITGLKENSEVRVYKSSDGTDLGGIENSTTEFTMNFSVAGSMLVDIVVMHLNYQYIRLSGVALASSDITIPVLQIYDRNYSNPE